MNSRTSSGTAASPHQTIDAPPHWMLWGLVLPLIVYAVRAVEILTRSEIPFDSAHTYLPLARRLLEDASTLFSDPESLKVAPGAAVYMALAGATPLAVKMANLGISLVALVMSFDAARRIGGRVAAVSAAWLFVLPHMLVEAGTVLLGESPFIFLVSVWLWATIYATGAAPGSMQARLRIAAMVLGGLALGAATLTRATYMYWLPFAGVMFLVASRWLQGPQRSVALRIAAVHLIALVLVGAYMAKQNEQFGRPMVATGAGAALYFGSNAVLSGYEPPYFGLTHDESTVSDVLGHLSLEGDRRLTVVAKAMLLNTPAPVLMQMYVQKLGAFLFFSRAHLDRYVMNDRSWRVILVVLALIGAWCGRRQLVVWMVTGAAAYQCAVHVPVLYNPRYSVSALDVLLVFLGAQGLAFLWHQRRRNWALASAVVTILIGIAIGAYHLRLSAPIMPDLSLALSQPVLLQQADAGSVKSTGWSSNPFAGEASMPSGQAQLEWTAEDFKLSPISILELQMLRFQGKCQSLWISHLRPSRPPLPSLVRLNGLQQGQNITWGLAFTQIPGEGPSSLTLRFECDEGTRMHLGALGIYRASAGEHFREQALSRKP